MLQLSRSANDITDLLIEVSLAKRLACVAGRGIDLQNDF